MPNALARPKIRTTIWQRYSLTIVLACLFLVAWVGQAITEWFVVANEAEQHGASMTSGDYLWSFGQSTLENWQS